MEWKMYEASHPLYLHLARGCTPAVGVGVKVQVVHAAGVGGVHG